MVEVMSIGQEGIGCFVFDLFFFFQQTSQLAPKMSLSDSGDWGLDISNSS